MRTYLALIPALNALFIIGVIKSVALVTASCRRLAPHVLLSNFSTASWYRFFFFVEERRAKSRGNRVDPSDQAMVSILKPLRYLPVV
jgi:hypothetical protein